MVRKLKRKPSAGSRLFQAANTLFMLALVVTMLYPYWYVIMYSLSDAKLAGSGGLFLLPKGFSLAAYETVLGNAAVLSGFKVSLIVTLMGTLLATFITAATAYAISKSRLRGRKLFTLMILFTMLFHGGMIPGYLLVKELGMLNSYLALILPSAIGAWNIFIMRSFFAGIPAEVEESAYIDGANDLVIFFRIVLPLSKAVLATIALFMAVMYWNDFFSTILYISSKDKWALQAVLRDLLTNTSTAMQSQGISIAYQQEISESTIKMANIVVATLPILIVYPFVQKYFVKGAMIGSVKG
ncbi:carbohydrate ABC transporter permease [Paenibacillus elgii]|uniref:carbohydrate ABC transporter permease n=1 Tax=Paenibacillus elgii TaxID=189691 RepID=UPI000248C2E0|nr:carbohydrate ABC transporter permease [Paenibacillus elgii]